MKKVLINTIAIAMFGFFIGAIMVADKNIAMNLAAIGVGLAGSLIVFKDIRRKI